MLKDIYDVLINHRKKYNLSVFHFVFSLAEATFSKDNFHRIFT